MPLQINNSESVWCYMSPGLTLLLIEDETQEDLPQLPLNELNFLSRVME